MSETAEKESKESKPCCKKNKETKLMKISDLPLYGNPYPRCDQIISENLGYIESGVKTVREEISKYLSVFSGSTERAQQIMTTAIEHSKSSYEYISSEANTVPKAVAITSGGFLGLLFASRKGFFKKITYTSIGLSAAAAACYPKQASELTQLGLFIAKTKGPEILKEYTGVDLSEKVGSKPKQQTEVKTVDDIGQESNVLTNSSVNKTKSTNGDFGMSKKDDIDLYANRSTK